MYSEVPLTYKNRNLHLCQICEQQFNIGERIPRIMVNCGHTFCTKCLTENLINGRLRCIVCKKLIKNLESVDKLPLNINILYEIAENDEILEKIKFDKEDETSNLCTKHSDRVSHFFCSKHRTIFCRECIKIDHTDDSCFVVDLYEIQKMKQIHFKNMKMV